PASGRCRGILRRRRNLAVGCRGPRDRRGSVRASGGRPRRRLTGMTFSIVARDGDAWGVAVASKFLAVGSVVPEVRHGVGAVATQAMARVAYRPEIIAALAVGRSAEDALAEAVAAD